MLFARGQCEAIQGKGGVRKPGQVSHDWIFESQVFSIQLAYSPDVISHHLFGGLQVHVHNYGYKGLMESTSSFTFQQDFRGDFKVLLPGGGTGDPLIHLCQELKGSGAQVFLAPTVKLIISTAERCS